jgi:hypothetical protein
MTTPVIINNRNRLTTLKQLLSWLKGLDVRVIILDNKSTYPPLLEFYKSYHDATIVYLKNLGHTALYSWGEYIHFQERYFIYTDSDVVPKPDCPRDVIEYLISAKKKYYSFNKIGLGIEIHDIPDHYAFKVDVVNHESQFWKQKKDNFFVADTDTTFAIYDNQNTNEHCISNCLRTNYPYIIRHMPWYTNSNSLDEEEKYYILHATAKWTGKGATFNGLVGKWTQRERQKIIIKF